MPCGVPSTEPLETTSQPSQTGAKPLMSEDINRGQIVEDMASLGRCIGRADFHTVGRGQAVKQQSFSGVGHADLPVTA